MEVSDTSEDEDAPAGSGAGAAEHWGRVKRGLPPRDEDDAKNSFVNITQQVQNWQGRPRSTVTRTQ